MGHVIQHEGRDEVVAVVVTLREHTACQEIKGQRSVSPPTPGLTSWSLKTTGIFFLEQTAIRLSGSSWPADRNWSSRP